MGIRTIIDLRGFSAPEKLEKKTAESMGFKWVNLPMGSAAPTSRQVSTFLAVLAKAPDEPVFVHCQYGADRTGCMIGIYRVQIEGWSFAKAWAEMRAYGFKPWLSELKKAVKSRASS
jgi:protein tyrosine/serine phosphatase